jgi:hypothetical protein
MDDEVDPQLEGDSSPAEGSAHDDTPEPQESMLDAIREAVGADDQDEAGEGDESRVRGPDGRFVSKDKPQAPAGEESKPEGAAARAASPPDKPAVDQLTEPEGLRPEASERFRALVATIKERDTELETVRAQATQHQQVVDGFRQMLADSQASDQEFLALLNFAKAVKTGNWQATEPMLAHLTQQYRVATGRDLMGADPFAQHPDVAQAVQSGQITAEIGTQIVRSRQVLAENQRQQVTREAQQREAQATEQAIQANSASVAALVAGWEKSDLDWPRKREIIIEQAKVIGSTLPPQHWEAAIKAQYEAVTRAMQAASPAIKPTSATPQPLRPSGASGGQREPTSMLEAVQGALGGG